VGDLAQTVGPGSHRMYKITRSLQPAVFLREVDRSKEPVPCECFKVSEKAITYWRNVSMFGTRLRRFSMDKKEYIRFPQRLRIEASSGEFVMKELM